MSGELETAIRELHANGLTPRDIAAALGIHESQVRTTLGLPRQVHFSDSMVLKRNRK